MCHDCDAQFLWVYIENLLSRILAVTDNAAAINEKQDFLAFMF